MIPAPALLIGGPFILAALVYLIRRLTWLAASLSAAGALALAWLVSAIPLTADESILGGRVLGGVQTVLGRPFALSAADQQILIVASVAAAVILLLAARLRPGDIFYPGLLSLLGVMAAVLVTETFVFQVFLVEVTAAVVTGLLQGSRFGNTRGAWRFFLFTTLALPLLLVAGWQIDFQAANPLQSGLLNPAVLLLTLGFLIYLAAAPFHLWLAPAASEAHPFSQITALGFFQIIVFAVISGAWQEFPWFAASSVPYQWFTFAGAATAGLGALLVFSSNTTGQLAAYNLLVDGGVVLLLLGLGTQEAVTAAWTVLLLRLASLILWQAGAAALRDCLPAGRFAPLALRGGKWQTILGVIALLWGALSLAGLPLTPGFAGRWMAAGLLARDTMGHALLVVAGSASGLFGALRAARVLLTPADTSPASDTSRWRWVTPLALALVIVVGLVLSLYPTPILSLAQQITSQFGLIR